MCCGYVSLREHTGETSGTNHARIILPVVNRHISTAAAIIAIGEELAHEVLEGESTLLEHAGFAVLREDYIVGCQCCGRTNGNAFLAGGNL